MHQRNPLLPTSSANSVNIDMRIRNQTKSNVDADDYKHLKTPRSRNWLRQTSSVSVSSVSLLGLLVAAFVTGLLSAGFVFAPAKTTILAGVPVTQEKEVKTSVTSAILAPTMQVVENDWKKKYDALIQSLESQDRQEKTTASVSAKNAQLFGQEEADDAKGPLPSLDDKAQLNNALLNKEKEKQMKELMMQSFNSSAKHKEDTENKLPVYGERPPVQDWNGPLPASSVWCTGDSLKNRVCKFRNICYNEKYQWFIVRNNASVLSNVPSSAEMDKDVRMGHVEISTIEDHPYTAWTFSEVSQFAPEFQNRKVRYFTDFTILFKRFHGQNIMHSLHDDVMPLFHHIRRYVGGYMPEYPYFDFNLRNHRIQFVDDYEILETFRPFQYLTDLPIGTLEELQNTGKDNPPDLITCFRDATAGVRKLTTWYQYGFSSPQGPIENKFVNGLHIRMVADYYVARLGLPTADIYVESNDVMIDAGRGKLVDATTKPATGLATGTAGQPFVGDDLIIILSRTRNRLISNEVQMKEYLEKKYKHQVMLVRNEDHTFEEQIILMRRAKVVAGMHGSILIMAMFCRKGTVLIEMYPYAVPAENYTPYKTMASLHGMHLIYRSWTNKHKENSVSHEDWPAALGGISHLPEDEQLKIKNTPTVPQHKCCVDPYWLFRIYQDTIVDIPEFDTIMMDGLKESQQLLRNLSSSNPLAEVSLLAPTITGAMFGCVGHGKPEDALWVRWEEPWNGARVDHYLVRTRIDGQENLDDPYTYYQTNSTQLFVRGYPPKTGVIFSVKSITEGVGESGFGDEAICFV